MTAMVTLDHSLAQRLEALEKANRTRSARAELKRDLRAGRRMVVDVIADPPGCAASMTVLDALLAAPKVGRVKAARMLRVAGVSPSRPLGALSVRQRAALVALLGGRR